MKRKSITNGHKIQVPVMFERDEILWLDKERAKDKKKWGNSRSAIIRYAVRQMMSKTE